MNPGLGALLLVLLTLPACGSRADIVIASKQFTESAILGEIARGIATEHSRRKDPLVVEHKMGLGGSGLLFEALQRGEVDLYGEYTGTLRRELLARLGLKEDNALRNALAERGLRMSKALGFNNTYVLGMRRERATELGIRTVSDLTRHPTLRLGFSSEFLQRSDGWPGLQAHYSLRQTSVRGLQHDLAYKALLAGQLDVIDLYSTDAEIVIHDLTLLEDDRAYFPRYDAVWLYTEAFARRHSEVVRFLDAFAGKLDAKRMQALNAEVKNPNTRRTESEAAATFLFREFGIRMTPRSAGSWQRLGEQTMQHLVLVLCSMLLALGLALPFGILGAHHRRFGHALLAATGVLQTIPSLVLFVILIPLVGLGFWPAVIALFLYSLLPILRNTITGLAHIPGELLESADALGLPRAVRLRRIELPMAAPQILAGIKTAVVINVGTATLAAFIGAGGLGEPIFTGIQRNDFPLVMWGAVPAALLALLVQGAFELLERRLVSPGLRL